VLSVHYVDVAADLYVLKRNGCIASPERVGHRTDVPHREDVAHRQPDTFALEINFSNFNT
jgi:hypothetical protein